MAGLDEDFPAGGRSPAAGEIFHQPNLARTLRSNGRRREEEAGRRGLAEPAGIDAVRDYFYRGDIAHRIDAFMQANGGLMRYEDLAAFGCSPKSRFSTDYHGDKVYKPGFWSQGPAMMETLNILEGTIALDGLQFGGLYPHCHGSAEAGVRRSRRVLRRSQVRENSSRQAVLESYAAERRKLIGHTASMEFLPGKINGKQANTPLKWTSRAPRSTTR